MKLLKPLLLLVGVLALASGAALAYLVATFDSARLKSEIERAVEAKTGRKLVLGGELSLSVFPDIAVEVGAVRLAERGAPAQEFAAVERARVSLKLIPLLSKRVEAAAVELSGLSLRIVRRRGGERNIDDLAGAAPAGKPTEAAPTPRFEIAGVRIEKAAISYVDELSGQRYALSDFKLATGRLANVAEGKFSTAGSLTGSGMNASFRLGGRYQFDLDARRFAVEAIEASLAGDLAGLKGVEAKATAAAVRLTGDAEVAVDKLALKAGGEQGGERAEVALELPALRFGGDKASAETLKLELRLSGQEGPLQLSLEGGALQGSASAIELGRLGLAIAGKRGELKLDGRLAGVLKANLAAKTAALPRLAGELTLAHPAMPMKTAKLVLQANARTDWGRSTAAGEATLKSGESTLQLGWALSRLSPPSLRLDAVLDRLNVDAYRPAPAPAAARNSAPAAAAAAASPIDLKALRGIEASGSVRIGALQAAKVKLANLRSDFRLHDGRLELGSYAANLYDGRLAGTASIDSRGNRIAVKQALEAVNINPLMRDALDKDLLEGRGNVSLDLTTSGASVAAMKRALAGTASLSLRDGAIKGINLAQSFRELKARVGRRQDAVQKASQTDKTDFSELAASFRIAGGVARNDDLVAKSPFLRLAGSGEVNVGEGSLDYLAKASVVNTSSGQAGKELAQLKGMTIPVRLSGPFDQLAYKIEFASVVEEAVKARVEAKVEQKLGGKIADKLRGLLPR